MIQELEKETDILENKKGADKLESVDRLGEIVKLNHRMFRKGTVLACGFAAILLYQNCGVSQFKSSDLSSSGNANGSSTDLGPGTGSQPEPGKGPPPLPPPVALGATVTDLKIENSSSSEQTNVPVTFGQVFVPGALTATETVAGKLSDGTIIGLQVEEKAKHPDGSLRHAIITAVIPKLSANQKETLNLVKATKASTPSLPVTPQEMLAAGFGANVNLSLGGILYTASPDEALKNGTYKTWLSGPLANEWLIAVPLKTSQGTAHPHLVARFAIRSYTGLNQSKVDVVIENNWAYEPAPQNFTYDVQVLVGGQTVYSKTSLNHSHHTRWKKSFWWGKEPTADIRHNAQYLIATRALPNYDLKIVIPERAKHYDKVNYGGLADMKEIWTGARTEPMATGVAAPGMPGVGGRPDMGLLPGWAAKYLISQDPRAKLVTLGTADLAGSYPMHYRDQKTDLPLSVRDWPYASLLGNPGDSYNPVTKKNEYFPACGGTCSSPNTPDTAHQPSLNYLPYLVTGDHYQLEELQFWAMYSVFRFNPHYRGFGDGLFKPDEMRGQAWGLRTVADTAYITPDDHPLKSHLLHFVDKNLDWYNAEYTNNPNANKLGVTINGYTLGYDGGKGLAPWQDDFFTQSMGHIAELGFKKAEPLLQWKARFSIARMTDPSFCWIHGASYFLHVREGGDGSNFFTTMEQVYKSSIAPDVASLACNSPEMAAKLNLKVGEMTGYSDGTEGYPSTLQPALAFAATSGAPNGLKAWQVFDSRTVKPDYSQSPQFAIVPRQ